MVTEDRCRQLLMAAGAFIHAIGAAAALYASGHYWKQPYHNSKLSGRDWVDELKAGHPDRIWTELGVRLHVFLMLTFKLQERCAMSDSQEVTLEEQVAIFLYMCVTGLSVHHVGERFQRSYETISK